MYYTIWCWSTVIVHILSSFLFGGIFSVARWSDWLIVYGRYSFLIAFLHFIFVSGIIPFNFLPLNRRERRRGQKCSCDIASSLSSSNSLSDSPLLTFPCALYNPLILLLFMFFLPFYRPPYFESTLPSCLLCPTLCACAFISFSCLFLLPFYSLSFLFLCCFAILRSHPIEIVSWG